MAELDKLAGWERTRAVYRLYPLAMPLIWILIGVVIGAYLFGRDGDTGYIANVYTEILSIGVTVFVLDYLNRQRDKVSRTQDLKEQLIRDANSLVNDVAVNAVHQIRKHEWLRGDNGILPNTDLGFANLEKANLWHANLQGTDLVGTKLQYADLRRAKLQYTNLRRANLQGAYLGFAKLQYADLQRANLQGAHLEYADLQGVKMWHTKFGENTILPDGTRWTPDTDMTRFTDPNHPDFWRLDSPISPAH